MDEDQTNRQAAANIALTFCTDTKLFENSIISADDAGPYIVELADQLLQYILKGTIPPFMGDNDDTTNRNR
jgi:hypothetical protein